MGIQWEYNGNTIGFMGIAIANDRLKWMIIDDSLGKPMGIPGS